MKEFILNFNELTKSAAAQDYVKQGYRVFPCGEDGKVPIIEGGLHSASNDPEVIKKWWDENPNANIGLPMKANGLVAVDIDCYKAEFRTDMPEVTETWQQATPSGGKHLIYRDCGYDFGRNLTIDGMVQPAIDIQHNAYIIAAPSSIDGVPYVSKNTFEARDAPEYVIKGSCRPRRVNNATHHTSAANAKLISDLLGFLNPDLSYPEWCMVLMGIHAETSGSNEGMKHCIEWSQRGQKFKLGEIEKLWEGFESDKGVTIGSIIHFAKEQGWQPERSCSEEEMDKLLGFRRKKHQGKLLKRGGDIPLSHADFVVDGLLEAEAISMVFGKSFSGKTFVTIDLALSCASGSSFYGHEVDKPRPVIYAAAEGKNGIVRRCNAWCEERNIAFSEIPFYLSTSSVTISDPKTIEVFEAEIDDVVNKEGPPSLIVFDTLNRSIAGWTENSSDDMGKLLKILEHLSKRYKCNVCLVHHTGHEHSERGRGSSALYAGMDQSFKVSNVDGALCLHNDKMKDGSAPEDLFFCIEDKAIIRGKDRFESAILKQIEKPTGFEAQSRMSANEKRITKAIQKLEAEGKAEGGCVDEDTLKDYGNDLFSEWSFEAMRKWISRLTSSGKVYRNGDKICTSCGRE